MSGGQATPRQVSHLEVAVGVEQEVGRFEVPVEYISRVQCLERSEGLRITREHAKDVLAHRQST